MKKIILAGLTILTSFIGFSYGTKYELNQPTALYNLGTDAIFTFTNGANFNINSQYFVYQVKGSYNNRYTLFWANTGLYLIYTQDSDTAYLHQGYLQRFCRTTYNNECYGSATWYNIDEFLSNPSYTNADYFDVLDTNSFRFCFGYEEINESICFQYSYNLPNDFSQYGNSLGFTKNPFLSNYETYPELTSKFTTSPFTKQPTPNTPPTQYTCPTAQQLINTYPEQYNTGLCYSNNMIYSGGTIQMVTPKSIFELYPTRIDLNQDIQNYNAYCNNATTTQACQTMFEGKTEKYTLIAKIPQDVMPMQLYTYCNLTLNMDPNQTTCTTSTGTINNGIGINDIINNIGNTPITVITPGTPPDAPEETGNQNIYGSGSVFDKYKQAEDDIKRRNIIRKAEDTIQTMREIYAKLTGIFRARQGSNGIIPPLITGLIALIVLYKLFKK